LPPFLSIVIPAHNEEARLPYTLPRVRAYLESRPFTSELIVVDSGSSDGTAAAARQFGEDYPSMSLVEADRPGKGLAVKLGMARAKGDYRFICDADLSMPIEQVDRFLPPQLAQVDIAIGSREAPGAVRYDEPAYRHLVGRGFNKLVRLLAIPGIDDTQCGFKCFRGVVADDLFAVQTLEGWTFDVELLFVAQRRGYLIVEVPIPWYFNAGSHVRVLPDSLAMFTDLFRIRYNYLRGRYGRTDARPA
jgi:glycosyltransferase involved in cell wall biosynthesis